MKKTESKRTTQDKTQGRRLLLNKETVRNLLTAEQLRNVHGGHYGDDGNSSRNGQGSNGGGGGGQNHQ